MDRLLPSDAKEAYVKSQPLGRLGSVRDIADASVYLFANTGSYVTGQTLVGKWLIFSVSINKQKHLTAFCSRWCSLAHWRRHLWWPGIPWFPPFRGRSSECEGVEAVEALICICDGLIWILLICCIVRWFIVFWFHMTYLISDKMKYCISSVRKRNGHKDDLNSFIESNYYGNFL